MARVAGKKGTINEGAIGDLPVDEGVPVHDGTLPWHKQMENQGLEILDPEDDPGSTAVQLAQAVVRGDDLSHPIQAALAEELEGREHAVDLNADPDAKAGDDVLDVEGRATGLKKLRSRAFDPGEDYTLSGVQSANAKRVKEGRAKGGKADADAAAPAKSGDAAKSGDSGS